MGSAKRKIVSRWFDDDEGDSLNATLFSEIDALVDEARDKVGSWTQLPEALLEKFEISWIYHDNALEGNVRAHHELKAAIDKKVLSDVSLIPTYQEIKNSKAAIDYIRELGEAKKRAQVTVATMRTIHAILCRATSDEEAAGRYRREIPVNKLYFHDIEAPDKIAYEMRKLGEWMVGAPARKAHPIRYATVVHHRILTIFPFSQHSGRVARLTMNALLFQAGYWPAIVHAIDRQRYYDTLRGPTRVVAAFIGEALKNSVLNTLKFLDGQRGMKELYRASVG